jgi:hypothetical protein
MKIPGQISADINTGGAIHANTTGILNIAMSGLVLQTSLECNLENRVLDYRIAILRLVNQSPDLPKVRQYLCAVVKLKIHH